MPDYLMHSGMLYCVVPTAAPPLPPFEVKSTSETRARYTYINAERHFLCTAQFVPSYQPSLSLSPVAAAAALKRLYSIPPAYGTVDVYRMDSCSHYFLF